MDPDLVSALVDVGTFLKASGYNFIAVTPDTHRRVLARNAKPAQTLRDVFGWNRVFERGVLPAQMLNILVSAKLVQETDDGYRSCVRYASLGAQLFAHSCYPTVQADTVFFGPDTYRFCRALMQASIPEGTLVDVGCGSGVGGITMAQQAQRVILADINEQALLFARANVALAGASNVEIVNSDVLSQVTQPLSCVVCNPPYLRDDAGRTYRDGGGTFGEALALRIVSESIAKLRSGGRLLLYTGATIVDGCDTFLHKVTALLSGVHTHYEELDPDIFGDELDKGAYLDADRIAAVMLTATMP